LIYAKVHLYKACARLGILAINVKENRLFRIIIICEDAKDHGMFKFRSFMKIFASHT